MATKQTAALAALILISTPCAAFETTEISSPGMKFYISLPLDARNVKERLPVYGLQFQGKRQYETVNVDSRMLNFSGTGIEAKWIIAGVVAAGAAVAVASKDKKTSTSYQQQQQAQAEQQAQQQQQTGGGGTPCPVTPNCP
jgi:hypothetical protein